METVFHLKSAMKSQTDLQSTSSNVWAKSFLSTTGQRNPKYRKSKVVKAKNACRTLILDNIL